jgi:tRNA nucleotidyltransferase (CCA-adding enzyme)
VYQLLKQSGETAEELGVNVYLVGGSVRDLLRGEENLDIDIVIEGDGILFARTFGEKLRAKIRTHEKFGTAQIITGALKLDIATARTEYYESPAALPKVETSSIKKDLYRRDFTINTLAVKLNRADFGLLIDFFGGQRDLREKTIRVLHNLSLSRTRQGHSGQYVLEPSGSKSASTRKI